MAKTVRQDARAHLAEDQPRQLYLLLVDLPREGGSIPRGWIVSALPSAIPDGKARRATPPDIEAFGRTPVEI